MSDIHLWDVAVVGDIIGDIIEADSIFYTGPFSPGDLVLFGDVAVKNIGNQTGDINGHLFFYPGTANEQIAQQVTLTNMQPGETRQYWPTAHIPADAMGTLPVGIKVWSETETEPSWGLTFGALSNIPPVIPAIALGGILIAAAYLAKK